MEASKFGTFIATQRKAQGMTQAELADRIHVSDKTISKWERGGGLPDINNLEPLANALQMDLSELMLCERKEAEEVSVKSDQTEKSLQEALDFAEQKINRAKRLCCVVIIVSFFAYIFCYMNRYLDNAIMDTMTTFLMLLALCLSSSVLGKLKGR